MPFECLIEPYHRIPLSILSGLVERWPQTSLPLRDGASPQLHHTKNTSPTQSDTDQGDSWDNDWGWSVDDDDSGSDASTSEVRPTPAPMQETASESLNEAEPVMNDSYLISASPGGRYLLLAHDTTFLLLELAVAQGEYTILCKGSGCSEGETVTAILCLPLFVPSIRKNQIFAMIGYNSGWVRVFSHSGIMLTAQLLEPSPILSIKLRTPAAVSKLPVSFQSQVNEDEDVTILFENRRVVSIDGQSLWMSLRVSDGQRESGLDASEAQTSFSYSKWELDRKEIQDLVSLGPTPSPTIASATLGHTVVSTYCFPTRSSSRYISVGAHPMLAFHCSMDTNRPLLSAANISSFLVSRVANPVFSMAKTWWSGSDSERTTSSTPTGDWPPNQIEPATAIPTVLALGDGLRRITAVWLCPATTTAQRHPLAATSDVLGRVILWDVQHGEMVRMWKGVRDATCGWIECRHDGQTALFLVIYATRRGLLQVFHVRHGKRVGAANVGSGWRLVQCGHEPLGSSMISIEQRRTAMERGEIECGVLASCFLVGPRGEIHSIRVSEKQ